jgi:hypothetical protein
MPKPGTRCGISMSSNLLAKWRYFRGVKVVRTLFTVICIVALAITAAQARQIWAGGYGRTPPRFANANTFQGGFNFCRVMFNSDHREKQGWGTDYPGADINFSIRVAELTKVNVTMAHNSGGGDEPEPEAVVVRLTDDALFQCPMVFMEDAGTARFSDLEVSRLQDYLLKGGFMLVMDYHGTYGQQQFDDEIGRVLPRAAYPIVDLPLDHPLWHTQFQLKDVPQMPSIQSWRRSGGKTDRGVTDPPDARAVVDPHGRPMIVMVHNSDIPDGWEREGEDPEYFYRFSPDAYSVGINVFLYAATH